MNISLFSKNASFLSLFNYTTFIKRWKGEILADLAPSLTILSTAVHTPGPGTPVHQCIPGTGGITASYLFLFQSHSFKICRVEMRLRDHGCVHFPFPAIQREGKPSMYNASEVWFQI